jgi:polyhydroxyalkanoate synthesis regulator phasin
MPQPRQTTASREQLRRVINPLDLVVITRARLQEVVDEAVRRGRITRGDAADLVTDLLARGRSQADDLIGELEQLISRGRSRPRGASPASGRSSRSPATTS